MRRELLLICIAILMLTGILPSAGSFADGDHPIVLFIQCEPDPELEEGGTIPDLLFTIRNAGAEDYTLEHAALSGGYEDKTLYLDEQITVLAGGTKEFHLTDVPISDAQLGQNITYRLSWEETEWVTDEETEQTTAVAHKRETEAQILIERFVPPELSVSASASVERVRAGETFTVVYTITNDTKYDMNGLKLYDPEQSMQSIGLPSTELFAGESRRVEVTYTMGKTDMSFSPVIEYTVREREQLTHAETELVVESVVVDVMIEVQQYPTTSEGSTFAVTVRNAGNRTVTNIQLYDEINTPIDAAFDLAPDQSKVLMYTVPSAISSGTIRKIRFHLTAVDIFETSFVVTDPNQYDAVPFVDSDSVKLSLYVVLQRAYYDENGKLCGTIQFEIRNFSTVTLHSAVLTELRLFGNLISYNELQNGETYFVTSLQLDGVPELSFRVDAYDPAGQRCSTETIRLDLARLKELADQTDDPVYVYPNNPYFKDLDVKYRGVLRLAGIIVLSVAALCAIVCIVLYAIERKLKAKLPAEFEENLESTLQKTSRRVETPMFGDVPTEQFGYTVPIKLRNYGELTEEEAAARKQEYQEKLNENLREYNASPVAISKKRTAPEPTPHSDAAFAGTRIIPVTRPKTMPPVRDDIQLISVHEPEAQLPVQKPKPVESASKQQKAKPVEPEPKQQKAKPIKPEPRPQKAKPIEPEPRPEKTKPVESAPKPQKAEPKPVPPVQKPKPAVFEPVTEPAVSVPKPAPKPKPMPKPVLTPTAPRIIKAIEPPARRPIEERHMLHMNG